VQKGFLGELVPLLENGGTHEEEISELESELENIREEKVKGIITRAKAKWNIEVERASFLRFPKTAGHQY
jgi:hypothetical protein